MARVDYQAAFEDLAELVSSREGWGSDTLLAEIKKLEIKHRVSEDFIQQVARLYGVLPSVHTSVPGTPADTPEAAAPPEGKPGDPGPSKVRSRDEREEARAENPPQQPGRESTRGDGAAAERSPRTVAHA